MCRTDTHRQIFAFLGLLSEPKSLFWQTKFTILLMSQSVAGNTERCVTESAGERLIPSMNQHMPQHITFNIGSFGTNFTSPHSYCIFTDKFFNLQNLSMNTHFKEIMSLEIHSFSHVYICWH